MPSPKVACVLFAFLTGAAACSSPRREGEVDPPDGGAASDASTSTPDGATSTPDGGKESSCQAATTLESLTWNANQVHTEGPLPGGEGQLASTACAGASGGETVYSLDLAARAHVSVHVATSYSSPATVYARRSCDADATDVACTTGTSKDLDLPDLPPGPLYLVVDSVPSPPAEASFELDVTVTSLRELGETCDPAGVLDSCVEGVCSSAGGAAHCAISQGPPVVDVVQFFADDPAQQRVAWRLLAHDPDGDVRKIYAVTRRADGTWLDAHVWSPFHAAPSGVVELDIVTSLGGASEPAIASTEITLTDSSGNETTVVAPYLRAPHMKGLGEDCGAPTDVCAGELRCRALHCADVSGAADFCAQATSAPVVNLPGTTATQVVLPVGPGHLTGRCADATSQGEALVHLHISEPVTLSVSRTDGKQPITMYLRRDCADPRSELACAAYSPEFGSGWFIHAYDVPAGDYVLVVDGIAPTPGAPVPITIQADPLVATGGTCTLYGVQRCASDSVCSVDTCVAIGDVCAAPPALVPGTPVSATISDATPLTPSGVPGALYHLTLTQESDVVISRPSSSSASADVKIYAACAPHAPYLISGYLGDGYYTLRTLPPGEYTVELTGSSSTAQPVTYSMVATLRPILPEGATCDPYAEHNRCEDGRLCDVHHVCR